MKTIIKLEELGEFLFSIYLFSLLTFPWWFYPLFFFAPDLSMLGYILNPRFGAIIYNLIHHKAIALGLFVLGSLLHIPIISLVGVIFLGHSSLDRVLGYGLKFSNSFNNTNLGVIGRSQQ
jgi:hypothetical protein